MMNSSMEVLLNTSTLDEGAMNVTEQEMADHLYTMTMAEIIMWCVLYAIIAVMAITGNLLTIIVIGRNADMLRSVTNTFMLNIAVSDLITGFIVIPFKFQAALLQRWNLPSFLCSLVPFIETVSLTVSVLTLCVTAIDRYRAVTMKPVLKRRHAYILICIIWFASVAFSSPIGIFHRVLQYGEITFCAAIVGAEYWWRMYNIYLILVQYFVPLLLVLGTFVGIGIRLRQSSAYLGDPDSMQIFQKTMKKVILMLTIVVAAFTFCCLPLEIYMVLSELAPEVNDYYYINVLFFAFHWLSCCNSCVDPIILGIFHDRFRREYIRLFKQCLCLKHDHAEAGAKSKELMVIMSALSQMTKTVAVPPDGTGADGAADAGTESTKKMREIYNCHKVFLTELGIQVPEDDDEEEDKNQNKLKKKNKRGWVKLKHATGFDADNVDGSPNAAPSHAFTQITSFNFDTTTTVIRNGNLSCHDRPEKEADTSEVEELLYQC